MRVLDQLVAAGLMERREDPHDRRAKTLHLTEAGQLRAQVEDVLVALRRRLFDGISEDDLQACLRVSEALLAALGRSAAGAQEDYRP